MHSTDDEDVFNVDCKGWSNVKMVRLLLRKLGTAEHSRFVDFILPAKKTMDQEFSETVKLSSELFGPNTSLFHKRWKFLNIFKDDQQDYLTFATTVNKHCNDFKLADLTADDFKCLIFAQSMVSAEDAEIRRRVLTKLENEQGLTLKKLAEDCRRVISVKSGSKQLRNRKWLILKKSRANRHTIPHRKRKVKLRDQIFTTKYE